MGDINRRYGGAHVIMAPWVGNTKEPSLDGVVRKENGRENTDSQNKQNKKLKIIAT